MKGSSRKGENPQDNKRQRGAPSKRHTSFRQKSGVLAIKEHS